MIDNGFQFDATPEQTEKYEKKKKVKLQGLRNGLKDKCSRSSSKNLMAALDPCIEKSLTLQLQFEIFGHKLH